MRLVLMPRHLPSQRRTSMYNAKPLVISTSIALLSCPMNRSPWRSQITPASETHVTHRTPSFRLYTSGIHTSRTLGTLRLQPDQ